MPLPPTPWIKSYDNPELYLGGYRSGLEQQQITQRGALAAQEMNQRASEIASRAAIAQMENQTRRELAEKELAMEEHRRAIQDEQWAMQKQIEGQKIQQYATQAAAQMRISARIKAGEDREKVWMEEGAMTGLSPSQMDLPTSRKPTWVPPDTATGAPGYFSDARGAVRMPPAPRAAAKDPLVASQLRVLDKREETWNSALATATMAKNQEQMDIAKKELAAIQVERQRMSAGTNAPQAAMRFVMQPDGSYRLERPAPADSGEALGRLNEMNLNPLLPGVRDDAVMPYVPLNLMPQQ